ncbi:MAG: PD-(D/E)XK nuclease family protein, partial [Planctomycetota bacterium]|nr:PD-(D/E)XK nuclease family protein [Planctomycetota bacterium]
ADAEAAGLGEPGEGARADLAGMIEAMKGAELWGRLRGAKRLHRELDFLLQLGPVRLRGQIDLLYQAADGRWHIVDYKSDHVGEEGIAAHAERYELQMTTYALAASRWLGQTELGDGPADATLYFLRPGAEHRFD